MIKERLRNQNGLTLVEVLATLIISSIVVVILFSVFSGANKEYNKQTGVNQDLADVSYALNVLTNEIRLNENSYISEDGSIVVDDTTYRYDEESSTITKTKESETTVFMNNINDFIVSQNGHLINLSITANNEKTVSTSVATDTLVTVNPNPDENEQEDENSDNGNDHGNNNPPKEEPEYSEDDVPKNYWWLYILLVIFGIMTIIAFLIFIGVIIL
ncbi:hypothetical protein UACE39S_05322 [Ureibacillus acetophenoni]